MYQVYQNIDTCHDVTKIILFFHYNYDTDMFQYLSILDTCLIDINCQCVSIS